MHPLSKCRLAVFSRTRYSREALVRKSEEERRGGPPRDKPVALHFFDNTLNLFMTSGVALNVVVPGLHRGKARRGHSRNSSSTTSSSPFLLVPF